MYKRVLLAYDGTIEGRAALREGALVAMRCRSEVYLLSVVVGAAGIHTAEASGSGLVDAVREKYVAILEDGAERLRRIGFAPHTKLVMGEPARVIGAYARHIRADLVVVGHRKQSLIERWWSGASGAYLSDNVGCSLLISRNTISEEDFQAELARFSATAPQP